MLPELPCTSVRSCTFRATPSTRPLPARVPTGSGGAGGGGGGSSRTGGGGTGGGGTRRGGDGGGGGGGRRTLRRAGRGSGPSPSSYNGT
ncbi:hypothetical protein B1H29_04675 [Streptomyces pactum]|uniref:Uncharacterized protein n=1 Tax=Streptomyces pactum TaxID=68249 RepID=A0A1S6J3G1_9ACTN|nr:hypothetical protein B1H29_04675 [Streptomyces pactum]